MSTTLSGDARTQPQTAAGDRRSVLANAPAALNGEQVLAHVSVLDGLRGLAICLILLFHFMPAYPAPGGVLGIVQKLAATGWSGVDLAFVLSGLLITDVLLRTRGHANAARNFYLRRFLRVMPLYLGVLTLVFGVLPRFVPTGVDPAFDALQSYQGWYWGLSAEMVSFLHGFSSMESSTVDLGHLWVVAVVIHFYLLWPWLVWSVGERGLLWMTLAVIVCSLSLRVAGLCLLEGTYRANVIYQTPTCLDSFAIGALVTLLLRRSDLRRLRRTALVVFPASAGVVALMLLKKGLWEGSGIIQGIGLGLVSVAYGSMIVLLRTESSISIGTMLIDNPVLRFFGKYSYGLYVFHGLMIPLLNRWVPADKLLEVCRLPALAAAVCLVAKVAVSLGLAILSWHLLEARCLRFGKSSTSNGPITAATASAGAAGVA